MYMYGLVLPKYMMNNQRLVKDKTKMYKSNPKAAATLQRKIAASGGT